MKIKVIRVRNDEGEILAEFPMPGGICVVVPGKGKVDVWTGEEATPWTFIGATAGRFMQQWDEITEPLAS